MDRVNLPAADEAEGRAVCIGGSAAKAAGGCVCSRSLGQEPRLRRGGAAKRRGKPRQAGRTAREGRGNPRMRAERPA